MGMMDFDFGVGSDLEFWEGLSKTSLEDIHSLIQGIDWSVLLYKYYFIFHLMIVRYPQRSNLTYFHPVFEV